MRESDLAKWAKSLAGEDADPATRDRAATEILRGIPTASPAVAAKALHVLQSAWWPLTPSLIGEAVKATLQAARSQPLDAPELEDASLLLGNLCREDPAQVEA